MSELSRRNTSHGSAESENTNKNEDDEELRSDLNEWWADSMESYCFLRKIQDLLSDGKSPHERRFGMPLNGPVIPFGAMMENHSFSAKDYRDYINLVPKSWQENFLVLSCMRENLERRQFGRRP